MNQSLEEQCWRTVTKRLKRRGIIVSPSEIRKLFQNEFHNKKISYKNGVVNKLVQHILKDYIKPSETQNVLCMVSFYSSVEDGWRLLALNLEHQTEIKLLSPLCETVLLGENQVLFHINHHNLHVVSIDDVENRNIHDFVNHKYLFYNSFKVISLDEFKSELNKK